MSESEKENLILENYVFFRLFPLWGCFYPNFMIVFFPYPLLENLTYKLELTHFSFPPSAPNAFRGKRLNVFRLEEIHGKFRKTTPIRCVKAMGENMSPRKSGEKCRCSINSRNV